LAVVVRKKRREKKSAIDDNYKYFALVDKCAISIVRTNDNTNIHLATCKLLWRERIRQQPCSLEHLFPESTW